MKIIWGSMHNYLFIKSNHIILIMLVVDCLSISKHWMQSRKTSWMGCKFIAGQHAHTHLHKFTPSSQSTYQHVLRSGRKPTITVMWQDPELTLKALRQQCYQLCLCAILSAHYTSKLPLLMWGTWWFSSGTGWKFSSLTITFTTISNAISKISSWCYIRFNSCSAQLTEKNKCMISSLLTLSWEIKGQWFLM